MRQFQRNIDCARGMGQRADRNVVNTRGCNLADIFQSHSTARLELHFFPSERDGFAHLRRLHVVEQNDVDPFDLEKCSHLFEMVGLHFDPNPRTFLAQALDRAGESGEAGTGAQVIVLH